MNTPIFDWVEVVAAQNQKVVTISQFLNEIEDSFSNVFSDVIDNTNAYALATLAYRRNVFFIFTNDTPAPTATITFTVPTIGRGLFYVENGTSQPMDVKHASQPGTVPQLGSNTSGLFISDGTDVIAVSAGGGSGGSVTVIKSAVRVATTVAGTLSTSFANGQTVDGVTLATGDRILIKNQATGSENGIYTVNASGSPTRATDYDQNAELEYGQVIPVILGTVNANSMWQLTTVGPYTLDTTALTFTIFGGATTFIELADTPSAFANSSGKDIRVNSAENAVEFIATDIKIPVRVATTAAGTLSTSFANGQTVDGVTLATGDRILIKDQAIASENGVYTVNASGAPTRALDFNHDSDAKRGVIISVIEGTVNANTLWQHTTSGAITLGSTSLTFAQMKAVIGSSVVGINFIIDGGGSAITTGVKGYIEIPFAATITAVRLLADISGSIVVDIWKDTYANYPPTDADSITASAVPTITSAIKSEDTTLTGWTTSINAGDILGFNVDSATTVTKVTLSLTLTK